MKSARIIVSIACFFITNIVTAQIVDVTARSTFQPEGEGKDFAFIEPVTDTAEIKFIATVQATKEGSDAEIDKLYDAIRSRAQKMGANAFKLNSFKRNDSLNKFILILDTYYGTDAALLLNFNNHEKNVVYIFGDVERSGKSYSFKIDNKKTEIKGGTYFRYQNKEGQEVKINKGGFTGATLWIKWKENKPASFLTLTGFALGGGGPVQPGQVGGSFNTGRISYINGNLGHLLVSILPPGQPVN